MSVIVPKVILKATMKCPHSFSCLESGMCGESKMCVEMLSVILP